MVLWCFNVTVPDPVSLRCYQRSETNQPKTRWAPVSWLFLFLLVWCCLLRLLFTMLCSALSSFSFVLLFFPWWPNKEGQVKKAARSRAEGPAWLGGCFGFTPVFSGPVGRQGPVAGSPRKGSQVLLPCLAQRVS